MLFGLASAVIARPGTSPLELLAVVDSVQAVVILLYARRAGWPLLALPARYPAALAVLFAGGALLSWTALQYGPVGPVMAISSSMALLYLGEQVLRRQRRLGLHELAVGALLAAAAACVIAGAGTTGGSRPVLGLMLALAGCAVTACCYRLISRWGHGRDIRALAGVRSALIGPGALIVCLAGGHLPDAGDAMLWAAMAVLVLAPSTLLTWWALPRCAPTVYGSIQLLQVPAAAVFAVWVAGRGVTVLDATMTVCVLAATALELRRSPHA